ncbi:histone H2A.Z-specific chaperone CHZ1 [Nymphaea colorata]|uniref:histone H2A.Z-specific chaperone CHZ1 n=1 Tax=Nymphaea colorata TaxID=210225 RepID=UPI00129DC1F7|nr:histone H2A.Z-specific chaperone CHZ1 [Nymphaea colorata]
MEDSDDRKRKKPEALVEDGLTSLNPPKFAKSQDEAAISKLDSRDSDGGATKPELVPKGEENGSVGEEAKQEEQLSSHSGGEGQGAKKNEALDPQGTGSSANGKDKEIVKDKGKGKILVESETEDDEEDGGVGGVDEDTDSDLSDDPLIEVDPANILPSWTRRRTAHSGPYPMSTVAGVDDDDDEDDDDISADEDDVNDDNDEDDDDDEDEDEDDD